MSKVIVYEGIAKYVFDDDVPINYVNNQIQTPELNIGDLNASNSTLYEDVQDVPGDFNGDTYLYDGNWTLIEG